MALSTECARSMRMNAPHAADDRLARGQQDVSAASGCVSEKSHAPLTDAEREQAIHAKGAELIEHMGAKDAARRRFDASSDLADLGDMERADMLARQAWEEMAALIRGRSPEAVAQLERRLGLL